MHNKDKSFPRIYYGWWLILVCLLIQAVGFGTSLYLYSVMIGAIGTEFEGSRFVMMMGVSGMLLLVGLMSPKIGSLLDRYPVKRVLIAGAVVMGSGFILMAFSGNIYHVVVFYALFIALGMTILSPLSCSLLLTRWFVRHRGLALGVSALGTQFGGLVFPPVVAAISAAYDWRVAAICLGVFILCFVPALAWFFVYDHPCDKGLHPDGDGGEGIVAGPGGASTTADAARAPTFSMRAIYSSPNFIIVVAIITFMSMIYSGLLSNISLIAVDKGETLQRGAFLVSLMSLVGMVSSPLLGRLSDILSVRKTLVVLSGSALLALVFFHQAQGYGGLVAAMVCFGFFGGAVVPVWSAALSRLYDSRIYGRVLGASSAVVYSLAALSAPTIGFLYDLTQSYQITFVILASVAILLIVSIARITPQQHLMVEQARN
ncbi:MAG: MFS transporter [Haliea sp.]